MEGNFTLYNQYIEIIKRELVPAMGCTEPVAISFTAAVVGRHLGNLPDRVTVGASSNLIKNVRSVIVPNTDGLKGIEVTAAAGLIVRNADLLLEAISQATSRQKAEIREYLDRKVISVKIAKSDIIFDLILTAWVEDDKVVVHTVNEHTNTVYLEKNGEALLEKPFSCKGSESDEENVLTVDGILNFAKTCNLEDVRETIWRQISYNMKIAEEDLDNDWGANAGEVILKTNDPKNARTRAKAKAAAGSGARMSGCELPVVINSGSGNQGVTASVPVIEYAGELHSTQEELHRVLMPSNLLGLHQRAGIGRLSAYRGAASAGCATGAGIVYLTHEDDRVIKHAIVNCLAITSGTICDGAKLSCAARIASPIGAVFLTLEMARDGQEFESGDGIVKEGIENTVVGVSKLGKDGMREVDKEILRVMVRDRRSYKCNLCKIRHDHIFCDHIFSAFCTHIYVKEGNYVWKMDQG